MWTQSVAVPDLKAEPTAAGQPFKILKKEFP